MSIPLLRGREPTTEAAPLRKPEAPMHAVMIAAHLSAAALSQTPEARLAVLEPQLRSYFSGEVAESWLFVGLGAAAIGGGVFFLTRDSPFWQGAAYPLMGVALIQLVVGAAV